MDKNHIYDYIVRLGGDCFKKLERPPCQECPFQDKCLNQIIGLAKDIPKEARLQWALDELIQDVVLDDK